MKVFCRTPLCGVQKKLEGASRLQQMCEPFKELGQALSGLFTPALRLTTGLLMFIWFTNALNYYGLVLLTTTVLCHSSEYPL